MEQYDAAAKSLGASTWGYCHTFKVRPCQRYALFFEYMSRNSATVESNISTVAQARISVLVIRRCVTHRLAALLLTVEAVRYASCTACRRWDRVNKHRANDTHRSGTPTLCRSELHGRAERKRVQLAPWPPFVSSHPARGVHTLKAIA